MKRRHVYSPPKGSRILRLVVAVLGGLLCAFFVFYFIPLLKRLDASLSPPPEVAVEEVNLIIPPDDFVPPDDVPDDKPEPEPEPELNEEDPSLDLSLDIGDLSGGVGSTVIDLGANFSIADNMSNMFESAELDGRPRAKRKVPAPYPSALKKKKIQGRVLVWVSIDEKGNVTETSIKESSGHKDFDEAAKKALLRWKFSPGKKDGVSVATRVVQPYSFKLNL